MRRGGLGEPATEGEPVIAYGCAA